MNIIKSAKISRFLLKSVRDFNEFHTPRRQAVRFGTSTVRHADQCPLHTTNSKYYLASFSLCFTDPAGLFFFVVAKKKSWRVPAHVYEHQLALS